MITNLEALIAKKNTHLETIKQLEIDRKVEADKSEFYRVTADLPEGLSEFDPDAMRAQADRSADNVKEFDKVLKREYEAVEKLDTAIKQSNGILEQHGTHACLLGTVPHDWEVLATHPSGAFAHRRCRVCGTEERVGYV